MRDFQKLVGQKAVKLSELQNIYFELKKPKAKLVKLSGVVFVSLESNPSAHFKVLDEDSLKAFGFIEKLQIVEPNACELSFVRFLFYEFFQGPNYVVRFIELAFPLSLFNYLILTYSSSANLGNLFSVLITAISIFIAIFTLFTVNNEYMERKKIELFESGKLGYLFSVDYNIAKLGIYSILFGIIGSAILPKEDYISNTHKYLVLVLLNFSFLGVWITLRSIVEFYIHRPAKYIMGSLKNESLDKIE